MITDMKVGQYQNGTALVFPLGLTLVSAALNTRALRLTLAVEAYLSQTTLNPVFDKD